MVVKKQSVVLLHHTLATGKTQDVVVSKQITSNKGDCQDVSTWPALSVGKNPTIS